MRADEIMTSLAANTLCDTLVIDWKQWHLIIVFGTSNKHHVFHYLPVGGHYPSQANWVLIYWSPWSSDKLLLTYCCILGCGVDIGHRCQAPSGTWIEPWSRWQISWGWSRLALLNEGTPHPSCALLTTIDYFLFVAAWELKGHSC